MGFGSSGFRWGDNFNAKAFDKSMLEAVIFIFYNDLDTEVIVLKFVIIAFPTIVKTMLSVAFMACLLQK